MRTVVAKRVLLPKGLETDRLERALLAIGLELGVAKLAGARLAEELLGLVVVGHRAPRRRLRSLRRCSGGVSRRDLDTDLHERASRAPRRVAEGP